MSENARLQIKDPPNWSTTIKSHYLNNLTFRYWSYYQKKKKKIQDYLDVYLMRYDIRNHLVILLYCSGQILLDYGRKTIDGEICD